MTLSLNSPSAGVGKIKVDTVDRVTFEADGAVKLEGGMLNSNGSLRFEVDGSVKATLSTAGNLLVGGTDDTGERVNITLEQTGFVISPRQLRINSNSPTGGTAGIIFTDGNNAANNVTLQGGTSNGFVLGVNLTERARITSAGYFKASNTGTYGGVSGAINLINIADHVFQNDAANASVVDIVHSNTAGNGITSFLPTGATGSHYIGNLNGTPVYRVLANGNVQNTNNSYGAISDAKLKENITPAQSYLQRFMQVQFKNFNFIGSDLKQFGVIAQELEQVFPGLVEETPDTEQVTVTDPETGEERTETIETGTVTKSVKYSVLAQIQGKVIQEQQALIEQLMARVTALENK